ncbi:ABC transporter ATP-binding protein [Eisenbergiella sp.]
MRECIREEGRRNVMKNNFWMLRQIWKYTPGYVVWMVIEGIVWGINHSVGIIYMQQLFDALGEHVPFHSAARVIAGYALYLIFFYLFHHWYWQIYNPKIREKLHIAMHTDMFRQAVAIDLSKYDAPEFYNDFVWAMDQSFDHAVGLMEDTGKLINRIMASVTLTGVMFGVDSAMAVIIFLLAAVRIGLTLMQNKISLSYRTLLNPLERKESYIERVFRLPDYAKELRVTHVTENLFDEYRDTVAQKRRITDRYGKRFAILDYIRGAVEIAGESGLIVLMLYKVMVTGEVGLGGFAVAVNASWKMVWFLRDMVERLLKYHEHGIFIEKMRCFMNSGPAIIGGTLAAPAFESLEFRNVSFSYNMGKKQKSAVSQVNLKISRGEKIAVVGYNGAGKTTLTKLIMRLYDPDEGEILYNSRNLKEYTLESIRQRMAAVFQDYRIFACSIGENVAGGRYDGQSAGKVLEALENSSFTGKLGSLPQGIDTQLTREFENSGTQLSGGEQQKLAIARAFYKNADLIILDEPSSALDPDAEYELNQAVYEYAASKTVIFISHRLSTTKHADRIYMFDGGRLIECGTHEELTAAGGRYAYMFRLQAEKYRE